ncbi:MAG: hypothetical protein GYA15_16100 [Leptolinea sp.]|jgi:hypothetical protein|nr:hypothetical protein [Leptolinea sp.]
MEIHSHEKKRAQNVIWNASDDYSFRSEFEVFDDRGEADLYWNFIIGAVYRYYDFEQLTEFFNYIKQDPNHCFYEELAWIGLENSTFEKVKCNRPVLERMRRRASERTLRREYPDSFYFLIDELKRAHFQRVLHEEVPMREQIACILNELEFDASLSTEEIIQRLRNIIDENFPLSIAEKRKSFFKPLSLLQINLHLKEKEFIGRFRFPFKQVSLVSIYSNDSKDPDAIRDSAENPMVNLRKNGVWRNFKELQENRQREMIQSQYGISILPDTQTRALEQAVCVGSHKNCRLHLTRGEFDPKIVSESSKAILKQKEKNYSYFKKHYARNNNCINHLTNVIKNTMLVLFEPSNYRAETGQMMAGRVWRSLHLDDSSIFLKTTRDDIGTLSVDILLDASGSQQDRQEILSSEGYVIAESLKRCNIPVKVFSFCTRKNFTVLNLFRDYDEDNKNDRIFSFRASGCNRDGLALRTTLHMISRTHFDHKILIVLSDGKPIDPYGISTGGLNPDLNFYSDRVGVSDAAAEVRKGRQEGISILCVFTGQEEDLPAAKKIYGNDLVSVKTPEKFADIVGVLLKNELKNL